MIYLGLLIVVLLGFISIVLALAEAVIHLNDEDERPTQGLAFTKLVVVSVYAVVLSLILVSFGLGIWWVVLISLGLVIALVLGMQLTAKSAGKSVWASRLVRALTPLIRSINLFFTPLSLPTESTEEYEQELIESVEELVKPMHVKSWFPESTW